MLIRFIRILIISFLILILTTHHAFASSASDDDSCTNGQSIFVALFANITSLGLFSSYSDNFHMSGAGAGEDAQYCDANFYPTDCSGSVCSGSGVTHDAKSCVQCTTSNGTANCQSTCDAADPTGCTGGATCVSDCNPNGGMQICYDYFDGIQNTTECNWVTSGWNKTYLIPPAQIKVITDGDKICAQFWTPSMGYQTIGCKYLPDCSQFSTDSSCYVAQSCSSVAYQQSRSLIGITGAVVQCVQESLARLFVSVSACDDSTDYTTNYFPSFQVSMRQILKAAISLYFMLFGIKMCLGSEMPSKSEFFTFGAKYVLVLYFSVGILTTYDNNGDAVYTDGISTIILPLFVNGSTTLANIVYSAGGNQGLCAYNPSDYPSGYGNLALWDSLDCRILYYLGLDLSRLENYAEDGTVLAISALAAPILLTLLLPAILSFQLIFAVFAVFFVIFLLSIVIYFVNIVILSMVGVAILVYMAPIFVPMALFPPTKQYFDGWMKLLISYALQPMVISAYLAMMLSIFDQTMFGNCQFQNQSIQIQLDSNTIKTVPFFMLCDPDSPTSACNANTTSGSTPCKQTIGYQINPIQSGTTYTESVSALFFNITTLKSSVVGNMMTGLVTLVLFAFLFYQFAEQLGSFAAELTGGTNIGALAGSPVGLVKKAGAMGVAALKFVLGNKKGAIKDAQKAAGGENSGGQASQSKSRSNVGSGGKGGSSSPKKG